MPDADDIPGDPLRFGVGWLGGVFLCRWEPFLAADGSTFESGCGNVFEFNDGTPAENGWKYCPYCGGRIREK